ncbi:MAG: helix-turn-helix transcriptional regulator [Deltaproteobacteria bacterium]|jgi:transcriptional regulator with XRE-family HTH domain|nr:helix-turn-helix transcriptional regulator [Deltaproteobacteria bacterium]
MANSLKTRLYRRRQELGLTQRSLAKRIGRGPTTISSYESGYREPSLDTIIRLAKALNCSVDWLLGVDGPAKELKKSPAWTAAVLEEMSVLRKPGDQKTMKMMVKALAKVLTSSSK